jgi:hypothetical protein
MAELPLAILGVALAWKGIIDFGKLINDITEDHVREKDFLAIQLQTSELMLGDWGAFWGPDTDRFQTLEPARKETIIRIIFILHGSREKAMERLRKQYHDFTDESDEESDEEADQPKSRFSRMVGRLAHTTKSQQTNSTLEGKENVDRPYNRLSRMVDKFVDATRRSKNKAQWLMGDRDLYNQLVKETMESHKLLKYLTSASERFLASNCTVLKDTQPVGSVLSSVERQIQQHAPYRSRASSVASASPTLEKEQSLDDRTLAVYASRTISSSKQTDMVVKRIEYSVHAHGDTRIAESIALWWNDAHGDVLLLETSDEPDDTTATSAGVLLYYLVDCHKLIFIFESDSEDSTAKRFLDMLRALIQSLVSIRGNQPLDGPTLPMNMMEMENNTIEPTEMQQLVDCFHSLLRSFVRNCDRQVLLIVDGLEHSGLWEGNGFTQLVRAFVRGLQDICDMTFDEPGPRLKALLTHKGHAMDLYDCVREMNVADLTDHAARVTSIREDLVDTLHG